jgi:ACR3 family arsenite efflux pump ArsB
MFVHFHVTVVIGFASQSHAIVLNSAHIVYIHIAQVYYQIVFA